MSHSEVYKWFELYFPQYAGDKVETWFQNGKNSIRIRQKNHQEFIFTFNNEGNWRFIFYFMHVQSRMFWTRTTTTKERSGI